MRSVWLIMGVVGIAAHAASAPAAYVIADFERGPAWPGASLTKQPVHGSQQALLWEDLARNPVLRCPSVPPDWTPWDRLVFWLYSEKANGQIITIVAQSENPANGADWDYYFCHIRVDWQGWRQLSLRRGEDLQVSRQPLGWNQIQSLSFHATGWDHEALPDTRLVLDDLYLMRDLFQLELLDKTISSDRQETHFRVRLRARGEGPIRAALRIGEPKPQYFEGRVEPTLLGPLGPDQETTAQLILRPKPGVKAEPLTTEMIALEAAPQPPGAGEPVRLELSAAMAIPPRPHPHLFLTAEEIARAKRRAERYDWAKATLANIIAAGDRALQLNCAEIPDHGGQWGHYYVCKQCGYALKTLDPTHHQCPKCQQIYSGWPWDDVIVSQIHGRFTRGIRDLGLAYAFTGELKYAEKAREILLAYAEKYPTFALHDVNGKPSRSAGRMYAQTLDEAVDIIGPAWGYDLVYNAPCFSAEDRRKIENNYLREACRTIQRYDAGISNWQSWHNAGVAAVGFCLDDPELMAWAINGKSGLRFQLAHSVLKDGWWHEGAVGYHWYALNALRYTVQAAEHAGIDFWKDNTFHSLFEAPVLYTFPNSIFPSVNDSSGGSIAGHHALYEIAYAHWPEPAFAWVAAFGQRKSLEAFLWGVEELPGGTPPKLQSHNFTGLGAAVLRAGEGEQAAYVHLDYGPHGGGHGHPDKLALILWALGQELAPDPGALAYAATLHRSWYRQTLAHNTIVVDQKSQQPTEGHLEFFADWGEAAIASASCDTAYQGVKLWRTVFLTPAYLLDLFTAESDQPHTYDYAWHNWGEMTPEMNTTAYPELLGKDNGYQHFTDLHTAPGDKNWFVRFTTEKGQIRLGQVGQPGAQLFFGRGFAGRPPQPCAMFVSRQHGPTAIFATVVAWAPTAPEIFDLQLLPATPAEGPPSQRAFALRLKHGALEELLLIGPPGIEKRCGDLRTTARALFVSREGDKIHALRQCD